MKNNKHMKKEKKRRIEEEERRKKNQQQKKSNEINNGDTTTTTGPGNFSRARSATRMRTIAVCALCWTTRLRFLGSLIFASLICCVSFEAPDFVPSLVGFVRNMFLKRDFVFRFTFR
jgi:hypothetical protein